MRLFVLATVCLASLHANTVYDTAANLTGTRWVGFNGGLADGSGSAYNHLVFNWTIIPLPNLTYDYSYTISGLRGLSLSHFVLDLGGLWCCNTFNDHHGNGAVTITFNSPRQPVWGDFLLISGRQYAYNLGSVYQWDTNIKDFIAIPGAFSSQPPTPEPATLGLTGAALVLLGIKGIKWRPRAFSSITTPDPPAANSG